MDEWTAYMKDNYPHLLQSQSKATPQRQMVDASIDAFEALERQLQQQQEERQRQQQQQAVQQQQKKPQSPPPGQDMDVD